MKTSKANKFKPHIVITLLIAFLFTVVTEKNALASGLATVDFNYINDLIGDRATGMGGAYTAISDDPSGAYYNPAGLVFAFDNQISLSVNNYKEKQIKFDKAVFNNKPYTQNASSFYPSFFGVVQSLGGLKVAFTILNINNEILDQDDYYPIVNAPDSAGNPIPVIFNINYNITDNTLLGGFSLASFFFSDSVSIGATVYGLRRRTEQISNQLVSITTYDPELYSVSNIYVTEEIYGTIGKIGLQWMPLEVISIGACITKGYILSHEEDTQKFEKEYTDGNDFNDASFIRENKSYKDDQLPINIRTGFAYFPNKTLTLSTDFIAHIGNKYYRNVVKNTYNGAIGMEYYITGSMPIRLGIFTNFANTPVIDKTSKNQEMHIDLYGASLSFSWETRSSSISFGGFYQTGKGKAQLVRNIAQIQNAEIRAYSLSLTGSAKY